MAFDTAHFENPRTGRMRSAPMGFSWTTFFFGPFPMLFRGAWKWFLIVLLTAVVTYGLAGFVWMFIINKLYLKDLIRDGYKLSSTDRSNTDGVAHYVGRRVPVLGNEHAAAEA